VPCQSSPSTQVTPVTDRSDSIVRNTFSGLGIHLVDLAAAMLPDPEQTLRPGQARVTATPRRWDCGDPPRRSWDRSCG
jgi:hypothetical protein